ncbi:MAG TPA: carbohydrate ABC transporter permease [Rubellimicrobium sp.]|nr:carbohydrate ABC transporter permease [Rubellimicrobium sp.]
MADAVNRRPPLVILVASGFVVLWLIVAAFPFAWTVWGSFKVQADFFSRDTWWHALFGTNTTRLTGDAFTDAGYYGAWVVTEFWRAALSTAIITVCVVVISLSFGTLGGYALARSTHPYRLVILLFALFFRAMPEVAVVSGYLYPFFVLNIWGYLPTAIIVLVALNQPFTLWMMYSFFQGIPRDLDESALVDGCTRFQAFRLAIVPVMWPGVITTGLFAFLLAYNDFTVTGLVLSENNQTMVPKIGSYLGQVQSQGNVMYAVAAVVSVTIPIFLLVMFFQRYLVSGLTAGAVKG